jgi:hypothetical protein
VVSTVLEYLSRAPSSAHVLSVFSHGSSDKAIDAVRPDPPPHNTITTVPPHTGLGRGLPWRTSGWEQARWKCFAGLFGSSSISKWINSGEVLMRDARRAIATMTVQTKARITNPNAKAVGKYRLRRLRSGTRRTSDRRQGPTLRRMFQALLMHLRQRKRLRASVVHWFYQTA